MKFLKKTLNNFLSHKKSMDCTIKYSPFLDLQKKLSRWSD